MNGKGSSPRHSLKPYRDNFDHAFRGSPTPFEHPIPDHRKQRKALDIFAEAMKISKSYVMDRNTGKITKKDK